MKKFLLTFVSLCASICASAQLAPTYDPSGQPQDMQYFKPRDTKQFVGDCIPFSKDGTYYLFWLLDEGHHSSLNGLGGHQWCVSTTEDLVHWTHYPIAIGIDEEWEKSICTGSVAFDGRKYYAFYATRLIDGNGKVNEQLSYAVSKDGHNFTKQKPNPFYASAPGYSKRNFRDPKVVIDANGVTHLFVASETEDYVMGDGRGCLVHLTSSDLKNWTVEEPVLSGQKDVPECPDYFEWNGWYYLVYGQGGDTYYVKSRKPYGPWEFPKSQALLEQWVNVAKTASFKDDRRIVAGWIPSKDQDKDFGDERFGGNVILREAVQLPDGDLATKWPEEVIPSCGTRLDIPAVASENCNVSSTGNISISAKGAVGSCHFDSLPNNCRVSMTIRPESNSNEYGVVLHSSAEHPDGYRLVFNPNKSKVSLERDAFIESVEGLDRTITVDIVVKDDIIDACIDGRRCIVNRLHERDGRSMWIYARGGDLQVTNVNIYPLN